MLTDVLINYIKEFADVGKIVYALHDGNTRIQTTAKLIRK